MQDTPIPSADERPDAATRFLTIAEPEEPRRRSRRPMRGRSASADGGVSPHRSTSSPIAMQRVTGPNTTGGIRVVGEVDSSHTSIAESARSQLPASTGLLPTVPNRAGLQRIGGTGFDPTTAELPLIDRRRAVASLLRTPWVVVGGASLAALGMMVAIPVVVSARQQTVAAAQSIADRANGRATPTAGPGTGAVLEAADTVVRPYRGVAELAGVQVTIGRPTFEPASAEAPRNTVMALFDVTLKSVKGASPQVQLMVVGASGRRYPVSECTARLPQGVELSADLPKSTKVAGQACAVVPVEDQSGSSVSVAITANGQRAFAVFGQGS